MATREELLKLKPGDEVRVRQDDIGGSRVCTILDIDNSADDDGHALYLEDYGWIPNEDVKLIEPAERTWTMAEIEAALVKAGIGSPDVKRALLGTRTVAVVEFEVDNEAEAHGMLIYAGIKDYTLRIEERE